MLDQDALRLRLLEHEKAGERGKAGSELPDRQSTKGVRFESRRHAQSGERLGHDRVRDAELVVDFHRPCLDDERTRLPGGTGLRIDRGHSDAEPMEPVREHQPGGARAHHEDVDVLVVRKRVHGPMLGTSPSDHY